MSLCERVCLINNHNFGPESPVSLPSAPLHLSARFSMISPEPVIFTLLDSKIQSCLQGICIAQQCPLASKYVGANSYHVNGVEMEAANILVKAPLQRHGW